VSCSPQNEALFPQKCRKWIFALTIVASIYLLSYPVLGKITSFSIPRCANIVSYYLRVFLLRICCTFKF
jgi:hypothetical protein